MTSKQCSVPSWREHKGGRKGEGQGGRKRGRQGEGQTIITGIGG